MRKRCLVILTILAVVLGTAAPVFAAPVTSDTQVLRVAAGAANPPYSYMDGDTPTGYDVELMYALGKELGMEVEVTLLDWPYALAGFRAGKYDVLAGVSYTDYRRDSFLFTKPVTTAPYVAFGKSEEMIAVTDLQRYRLAAQAGDSFVNDFVQAFGLSQNTTLYFDIGDGFDAVEALRCDFVVTTYACGVYFQKQNGYTDLRQSSDVLYNGALCLCVSLDNQALCDQLNSAIDSLSQRGELTRLNSRWLVNYSEHGALSRTLRTYWPVLLIIVTVVGAIFLITRLQYQRRMVRQLKIMAQTDALTGLMNKQTFCAETQKRLGAGHVYTLVRFDVDHFKMVNDALGTAAGDRLLQIIGSVLQEATKARREVVSVGRLDADHFTFCAEMGHEEAGQFCQQVEKAILTCAVGYDITLRFGLCAIDDTGTEIAAFCDHALMALRAIKDIYRDSIAWYDDAMRREEQRIQELEAVMEAALADGQFIPYFQAQYNYETGQIIGAEALVRWRHPEKGMIAPDRFIPQFEKNGFIYKMDLAVWEQVCAQMRRWLDEGLPVPQISVNVSRRDVTHSDLPQTLKAMVERYGLTPDRLHLETTESGFTENPEHMLEATTRLRAMGFSIEIDDFGSGYSSLNTLRELPADALKLDLRFLDSDGGTGSSRGGLILSAVVHMAHSIDMPVIAEGVETKEQADFLKSIGCLYMQGYYFARPVCAADFAQLLQNQRIGQLAPCSSGTGSAADFLDASTQSTLLFNSFVGGAGIFEYREGRLEALRLNDQFFETVHIPREGHNGFCMDMMETMTPQTRGGFVRMLEEAAAGSAQSSCYSCSALEDAAGKRQWYFNRARCLQRRGDGHIIYIALENVTSLVTLLRQNRALDRCLTEQLGVEPDSGGVTFQDALELMGRDFYKVLQVDLTDDSFQVLRSRIPEPSGEPYDTFTHWVDAVGASELIYEEDCRNFNSAVRVPRLADYFDMHSDCFRLYYRRMTEQGYRWVCMEILPTETYGKPHRTIMLYIRDVHESYELELRQRESTDYKMRHDVLTGVWNRLAYSEKVNELVKRHDRVGVVYADINGLKLTNDTKGHDAGDELIVDFSRRLRRVYGEENCYRISGDEFVVLVDNTVRERFTAMEHMLLTPLNREGTPIASYGAAWCEDSADFYEARRKAEEDMYCWKKVHYANHPELGRRE